MTASYRQRPSAAGRVVVYAHSFLLLVVVRILLPRAGLVRTLRVVGALASWPRARPRPPASLVGAVEQVARRLVPGSACLARSAALVGLLRAQGAAPELIVGCRRTDGAWSAHAWVESDGYRLDALPSGEHLALTRYRRANRWLPASESAQSAHPSEVNA